jgi:hypothetical protein
MLVLALCEMLFILLQVLSDGCSGAIELMLKLALLYLLYFCISCVP